jgi:hypothetical protein
MSVRYFRGVEIEGKVVNVPARFFSRKAWSSSSRSLAAFLGAFKGFALPPSKEEGQLYASLTVSWVRIHNVPSLLPLPMMYVLWVEC